MDILDRKPDDLADCGGDRKDSNPFGNGNELGDCGEGIPRGPSLVRKNDAIHQLPRPSVLYLRRLLVFEGIRGEGADYRDW